jgi:hypothetical protein
VIKTSKIRRRTSHVHPVARPSRIRRDPALVNKAEDLRRNAWWESREWEIRFAAIGITFFALAISAVVIDIGEILGH